MTQRVIQLTLEQIFSVIYSALCISRRHRLLFVAVWSLLTVAESRYGLGLPLKLRPPPNYSTYTKVNIFFLHFSLILGAYHILLEN